MLFLAFFLKWEKLVEYVFLNEKDIYTQFYMYA